MVSGIILTQLFIKPIGWVVGIVGALLWTVRPVPDGALFAVGRTPRLVLAGPGAVATPYDNLSDFLASMTALRLGKNVNSDKPTPCDSSCRHDFGEGMIGSIVKRSCGLSAACKDHKTSFVLTIIALRYRCRSGKPIYNISQKTGYNYVISIQKKSIKMISNSGLGQQVCPAL